MSEMFWKKVKKIDFDLALFIVSSLFIMASYIVYLANLDQTINADLSGEILTGREMFFRKTIFLRDWYFSTEIFLIRSSFFTALWLFITDNILRAFTLSIITEILLQTICFIYMGKRLDLSNKAIFLGIIVFYGIRTTGSGFICGMGGSSYATMNMTCFLVIGYYAAKAAGIINIKDRIVSVLIPVLAFLFGICSVRLLVILFFPIFLVHFCRKFCSKELFSIKHDYIFLEIVLWAVLNVIGILITVKFIMPLGFGPVKYQIEYTSGLVNIVTVLLPTLIAEFFRYHPIFTATVESNVFSLSFVNGFLSFLFFLTLAYFAKITWKTNEKIRISVYYIFISSLVLSIVTQLIFFWEAVIHFRYYMLMFVLFSLIFSYAYDDLKEAHKTLKNIFLSLLLIFFVTNSIYNISQLNLVILKNTSIVSVWEWKKITGILKKHEIDLAYALSWDSNSITVLSNGEVEIAPVLGNMTPMEYVVPYRYYTPDIKDQKTAFIKINHLVYTDFKFLPQFHISNFDIFEKAVKKETIIGPFYTIEIFIFDKNYFTFPDDYNPKEKYLEQLQNYS